MIDIKKFKPRYITDEKGNKIEVILPMNIFQSLLNDLEDLAVRAERKNDQTISHQELLAELNSDGLL